jgi:hypothetical protein
MAPKMAPMPDGKYALLLVLVSFHSLFGGYYAATRPEGAGWRFFSWHPMLMMLGALYTSYYDTRATKHHCS